MLLSDDGGTVADGGVDTSADPDLCSSRSPRINDPPVVERRPADHQRGRLGDGTLNVTDVDGDTDFTYAVTNPPNDGAASVFDAVPGQFTYIPNLDFHGVDQFTVTVTDNSGGGGGATVTITVTAVNDAPVAFPQSIETNEDTAIAVTLVAVDVENDPLTYAVTIGPSHGVLSGTAPNLVYTPAENYFGGDSIYLHRE